MDVLINDWLLAAALTPTLWDPHTHINVRNVHHLSRPSLVFLLFLSLLFATSSSRWSSPHSVSLRTWRWQCFTCRTRTVSVGRREGCRDRAGRTDREGKMSSMTFSHASSRVPEFLWAPVLWDLLLLLLLYVNSLTAHTLGCKGCIGGHCCVLLHNLHRQPIRRRDLLWLKVLTEKTTGVRVRVRVKHQSPGQMWVQVWGTKSP